MFLALVKRRVHVYDSFPKEGDPNIHRTVDLIKRDTRSLGTCKRAYIWKIQYTGCNYWVSGFPS